jgi:predicted nucleic acid-binding protein
MEAAVLLKAMVSDARHVFLEKLGSPTHPFFLSGFEKILGSKQVTDVYLLSLAAQYQARFLTFDTRLGAMKSPYRNIEVLTE